MAAPSLSRRVFRVHGLMDDESGTAPKPESPNSEGVRKLFCYFVIIDINIIINLSSNKLH